jgi:predicted HTH domain antitoxin
MASHQSHHIEFEYPDELLRARTEADLQRLAQEAFYVRLYQQGAISSGHAGAALGIGRVAFLDLLGAYGVSYFDEETDLADDLRNADQARS